MRRKVVLNYLYICTLSILSQSPRCLTQTAESASSRSDGQVHNTEEQTSVELIQNKGRISDEAYPQTQHNQLVDARIHNVIRPVRRKRELRGAARSVRPQGSAKSLDSAGLSADEHRFKKSNDRIDRNSGKSVDKRSNEKMRSTAEKSEVSEDQANEDERGLHKERSVASRSSLSTEKDEAKSGRKRSSYSGEAEKTTKLQSRAIKESVSVAQSSVANGRLKDHENGRCALGNNAEAQKFHSGNDQLEDEVDLDDKSAEYDGTGVEDDDDAEDSKEPTEIVRHKENDSEISQTWEKSEKPDQVQGSSDDVDSERQAIVKRGAGFSEEEYEGIEGQDDTCEDAGLIDDQNYQQAKIQSEAGLLEKKETEDSRLKRQAIEVSGHFFEKNEAPEQNEAVKQQGEASELAENVQVNPNVITKRDIRQTENGASSRSSFRFQRENLKHRAASRASVEDESNGGADAVMERGNAESIESSKQEDRSQNGVQTDNRDEGYSGERSNVRSGGEKLTSGEVDKKTAKITTEEKMDVTADGAVKDDGLYSDYERRVQEQIQKKIDSIKEEIKREVEEKQRIHEIEANNAKYDEIQSENDEDEDEDNQNLDIPSERRSVSKRSIINSIHSPYIKTKRQILRRVKRSDTTDARQLQALEGVKILDPDIFTKAQLRHESIRKRSAPIYGAVDENTSDTRESLIKRNGNPPRVYLVNNEHKRSSIPAGWDAKNTIIIPEQAHVNVVDELTAGLSLDSSLLADSSPTGKYKFKRSPERFTRRRRASAVVPEGKVAFLGYRPQGDDEDDEGNEFDDDGFEDRTSNLEQDQSYAVPHASTHDEYHGEQHQENPANFLFSGVDSNRNELLVRRERAGVRDKEETASSRRGGALARRQTRARNKQMQTTKITSRNHVMDRDKRQAADRFGDRQSDSVASLVGSSQELSPLLAIEYKEAFGGLQSDPGGALARYKRVKRNNVLTDSLG